VSGSAKVTIRHTPDHSAAASVAVVYDNYSGKRGVVFQRNRKYLGDPLLANDYLTRLAFELRSKWQGKGNQGHRVGRRQADPTA
jgi:hypothetical protein